jgi:transcriptional regulator with XRE-family HTH domain
VSEELNAALAEVGSRIRKARETNGLNLHELARLSGISAPALSLIETGKRDLRITTLYRIAGALRLRAGDLVEDRPRAALGADLAADPAATVASGQGYDLEDYR